MLVGQYETGGRLSFSQHATSVPPASPTTPPKSARIRSLSERIRKNFVVREPGGSVDDGTGRV